MPLTPGQTLAHFEILGPLGVGGMGEVYRARDTRLGREVALKVLPEALSGDEERLRRFEREAKTLASLSHPNVAGIHGVEHDAGLYLLALELVPGEDLARRLARGALTIGETVDVCRQIAEGLEAAHEAGVVHRDLKPANVCITPQGVVKVLDFGLAKPLQPKGGADSTGAQPDSFLLTEEGLVLGTPTYMSPEQARGRPVDRRADVWAFGCVLYECLTGRRAFAGASLADVLAAVVGSVPDYDLLPEGTPPRLALLLRRTLAKDPHQRLQHLGDARLELEQLGEELARPAASGALPRGRGGRTPRVARGGALALAAVLGGLATWIALRNGPDLDRAEGEPPSAPAAAANSLSGLVRVSLPIAPTEPYIFPRISPDGRTVVFGSRRAGADGTERAALYLRSLDAVEPVRLPGTDGVETFCFSPDGSALAVVRRDRGETSFEVTRVELASGVPRAVPLGPYAPEPNLSGGLVWTDTGLLVTTGNRGRLLSRPVEGGAWVEQWISGVEEVDGYTPDVFRALPGGAHVLGNTFEYVAAGYEPWVIAIEVASGRTTRLVQGGNAAWLPPGELLFSRGDTLFAVGFDKATLEVRGEPRRLLGGLRTPESWRAGWFDLARDGTLVHQAGGLQGTRRMLVAAGPDGPIEPWSPDPRAFDGSLRIARDGSFVTIAVAAASGLLELWGTELERPLLRPLLARAASDFLPGPIDAVRGRFYFTRLGAGEPEGVWSAPLDDPERAEPVWTPEGRRATALELSPDGSSLFVRVTDETGNELVELALDDSVGAPRERALLELDDEAWSVELSPDGSWLAYSTSFDGQRSIVLRHRRADGSLGPVIPVPPDPSTAGTAPARYWWCDWSTRAGAEHPTLLLYSPYGQSVQAVEVRGEGRPSFSSPRPLVSIGNRELLDFAGLPDGRVLMLVRGEEELSLDRIELVFGVGTLLGK